MLVDTTIVGELLVDGRLTEVLVLIELDDGVGLIELLGDIEVVDDFSVEDIKVDSVKVEVVELDDNLTLGLELTVLSVVLVLEDVEVEVATQVLTVVKAV